MLKYNIEFCKNLAEDRGGECLSNTYINCNSKLMWRCFYGHIWLADLDGVKHGGTWCPYCRTGIGEKLTRCFFEVGFNKSFKKSKPIWLITSTGKRLELDGYNDELKIAFEYDGEQHKKDIRLFNSSRSFEHQLYCDSEKNKRCSENGVVLVRIEFVKNLKYLSKIIYDRCISLDLNISNSILTLDYKSFNVYVKDLDELRNIVELKGGKLISNRYIHSLSKLDVVCKNNHLFKITSDSLKSGRWCARCYGNAKHNIDEMCRLAKLRGGKCLSDIYINSISKLKWQCKNLHIWETTPHVVLAGKWCPVCNADRFGSIEEMKVVASKYGGKCLSTIYINSASKLKWRCDHLHVWEATPSNIKAGHWCPFCSITAKKTLSDIQKLAISKGGKCLADEYKGMLVNLIWQCNNRHIWSARPNSIQQGSWCPVCN